MKLTAPTEIKALMARHDLHFNKHFGQNFLIDENTVARIADAADIGPQDCVIEVGPGIGTLTQELAARAADVVSVEIDKKLIPVLGETLTGADNVQIVSGDILKTDLHALCAPALEAGRTLRVAANLPYYITTPVIMKFLESGIDFESMSFLVQKEVGERMAAAPGSKTYGALSIISQYYADVKTAFTVPASVFMPKPAVDSVVITLKMRPPAFDVDRKAYFTVVKAAFANRRKTLMNALSANLPQDKAAVRAALEAAGIDPGTRAEQLSPEDFARLTAALYPEDKTHLS